MPRRLKNPCRLLGLMSLVLGICAPAGAQVDEQLAETYFDEAKILCEREDGRLWGVSLCGPMVFADPVTQSIATDQPAPPGDRPRALGFANAAMDWGGVRWSTNIWQMIPVDDEGKRAELMLHELFHRIQAQLGFMTPNGQNDHLDTLEGRYWLQLEWRALAQALRTSGPERTSAVGDALGFRLMRRALFPDAAANEQPEEIREGLAQYTATVAAAVDNSAATLSAIDQLASYARQPTFVRTFAYPTGTAYGILLDAWSPGWTRQIQATADLGELLITATNIQPTEDVTSASSRYGSDDLRAAEEKRDIDQKARVALLRQRFVDGPVLVVPRGRGASFITTGATPIPGAGTTLSNYRVTGEWGSLEADNILVSVDGETLRVPATPGLEGTTFAGDGWSVTLATGWIVRPGPRAGDFEVVRDNR